MGFRTSQNILHCQYLRGETLQDLHKHFEECQIPVFGELDHDDLWYSNYIQDPNGQQVELTYQTRELDEHDVEGLKAYENWRADKNAGKA